MTPAEQQDLLYPNERADIDETLALPDDERIPMLKMDLGWADWNMRQVEWMTDQADEIAGVFDEQIAAMKQRKDEVTGRLLDAAAFYNRRVEAWHRAHAADGLKVGKTVKFPGTRLRSELRGGNYDTTVTDYDALRAWAEGVRLDDGRPVSDVVFPVDWSKQFRVSELRKVAKPVKAEANAPTSLVVPESGEQVPGVRVISLGDRHQLGGKSK